MENSLAWSIHFFSHGVGEMRKAFITLINSEIERFSRAVLKLFNSVEMSFNFHVIMRLTLDDLVFFSVLSLIQLLHSSVLAFLA